MNHLSVVRILAMIGLSLAGVHFLCGLFALTVSEATSFTIFMASAAGLGTTAGTVLLITDRPDRRSRPIDGLAVAILFWLLAPLALMAPFFPLTAGMDTPVLVTFYEAVSNLTTTGHSLIDPSRALPSSLLLWRAALHLIGAIAIITIAATVFAALNLGGPGIHRSRFFTLPEGNFFDASARTITAVAIFVLAGATLTCLIFLIGGLQPRDALAVSVSVITTGLVNPELAVQPPPGMTPILYGATVLGLICGTLGLIFVDSLWKGQVWKALFDAEPLSLYGALLLVTVLAFMAGLPLLNAAGWGLSSLSTSGIQLVNPTRLERLPLVLELFPVLLGGAALSTAGGIKLSRMLLLSRRVGGEFTQLGFRQSLHSFKFRGIVQSEETLVGIWVYLVGYIMACVFGIFVLAVFEVPFNSSVQITIGALANAGHLLQDQMSGDHSAVVIASILGMILGRLEVIALLPALNPYFWQR